MSSLVTSCRCCSALLLISRLLLEILPGVVLAANRNYVKSFTSLQYRNVQRLYGIDSRSIHRCLASSRWSASIIYRPFLIDLVTFPVISDVHRLSRMLLTCPAQVQFCLLICSTTSMILCEMVERWTDWILEERYLAEDNARQAGGNSMLRPSPN